MEKETLAEKILSSYKEKESTELDELRRLDKSVKRPIRVFSIVFGSIWAIVMGAGMSLIMTDIGDIIGMSSSLPTGLILGITGLLFSLINYPLHKKLLSSRKKKYAPEIIALSNKITNN